MKAVKEENVGLTVKTTQMELEQFRLGEFRNLWFKGQFGNQRYGQAFYNYFNLHKLADQVGLRNMYELDGDAARKVIGQVFRFN